MIFCFVTVLTEEARPSCIGETKRLMLHHWKPVVTTRCDE
jgi:hypothetical protein